MPDRSRSFVGAHRREFSVRDREIANPTLFVDRPISDRAVRVVGSRKHHAGTITLASNDASINSPFPENIFCRSAAFSARQRMRMRTRAWRINRSVSRKIDTRAIFCVLLPTCEFPDKFGDFPVNAFSEEGQGVRCSIGVNCYIEPFRGIRGDFVFLGHGGWLWW